MYDATRHPTYLDKPRVQRFELAFPLTDPDFVGIVYDDIVEKGAIPVSPPEMMP